MHSRLLNKQTFTAGGALWRLWSHIPVCTFSYGSFNVAIISLARLVSNGVVIMNNEFKWMCQNVSEPTIELVSAYAWRA
jgi:hypothetical protein